MHDQVNLLYAAAVGEAAWDTVINDMRANIGADVMLLGIGDVSASSNVDIWASGEEALSYLDKGYTHGDTWDPEVNPCIVPGLVMPVGQAFDRRAFVPDDVAAQSEFIQEAMSCFGFMKCQLFVPRRDCDVLAGGYVARAQNLEISDDGKSVLNHLVPHMGRALHVRDRLERNADTKHTLCQILEGLPTALYLIDRELNVMFANAAAEEIAVRAQGITINRSRFTVPLATECQLLFAMAELGQMENTLPEPTSIPVRARTGEVRYLLKIFPATGLMSVPGSGPAAAMIFAEPVLDPPRPPSAEALQLAFELTPRETAVAQLVPSGWTRHDIGTELGMSENTVKTHLAAIFEKTGTRNAIELAALLSKPGLADTVG